MPWTAEQRAQYRETMAAKKREADALAAAAREAGTSNDPATEPTDDEEPSGSDSFSEPEEYFPPPVVAAGGRAPDPVEEPEEDEPYREPTEFDLFLATLSSETREMLSDDELLVIYEDARAKAEAEKKARLKKAAADRATTSARIAAGVIPKTSAQEMAWKERMDEIVDYTIDLPTLGDGLVDIGLRIDQKVYLHGISYPMTRAQYESYRDIIYRAQQAELLFEGRDKRHWLRRQARGSVVSHIG